MSPSVAVLAIVGLSVAALTWWTPAPPRITQVTVNLPPAVYDDLTRQVKGRTGADGRALTIAQAIAELTSRLSAGRDEPALSAPKSS